jgi:hypothetical protein
MASPRDGKSIIASLSTLSLTLTFFSLQPKIALRCPHPMLVSDRSSRQVHKALTLCAPHVHTHMCRIKNTLLPRPTHASRTSKICFPSRHRPRRGRLRFSCPLETRVILPPHPHQSSRDTNFDSTCDFQQTDQIDPTFCSLANALTTGVAKDQTGTHSPKHAFFWLGGNLELLFPNLR